MLETIMFNLRDVTDVG